MSKLVMHSQNPKKVESPESAKHEKSQSMTSLDQMKTVGLANWQMKTFANSLWLLIIQNQLTDRLPIIYQTNLNALNLMDALTF